MSDSAVRSVLSQAFNTETTKNHGAARSISDDKSPQAILQQPRMEVEQQAETQAAHAEVGQNLSVMRRQEIRNCFDFNDQLPVHENVRAKAFVELDAFVDNRDSGMPGPVSRCTSMASPMTRSVNSRASSIPSCLRAAPWFSVPSVLNA